jgi:uncharacterized membrane protein (DUF4010 family)
MSFDWFLPRLSLALVIGLMIGVERGWQLREEKAGTRVAGVRTFSLLGLLGGLAGIFLGTPLAWTMLVLILATNVTIIAGYWRDTAGTDNISITSATAAILTLALGAAAGAGYPAVAAVCAGVTIALLAWREPLHRILAGTSDVELRALVRLVLVVFVVYPLLPDHAISPFGINPRRIWTVIVVLGSISFCGHVLMRLVGGRKGLMITALVGSLVSSTAVTLECARRIRMDELVRSNQSAIAAASSVMMVRAMMLVTFLVPKISLAFFLLVLPAFVIASGLALLLLVRGQSDPAPDLSGKIRPPSLATAFAWGGFTLLMTITTGWAEQQMKGAGSLVIAAGGLLDIDSAIAAVATLPSNLLDPELATKTLAAVLVFNSLLKAGLALVVAGIRRAALPTAVLVVPAAVLAGTIAAR